jgi:hypothetical protein
MIYLRHGMGSKAVKFESCKIFLTRDKRDRNEERGRGRDRERMRERGRERENCVISDLKS